MHGASLSLSTPQLFNGHANTKQTPLRARRHEIINRPSDQRKTNRPTKEQDQKMPRKSRKAKSEGVADPLALIKNEDQAALDAREVSGSARCCVMPCCCVLVLFYAPPLAWLNIRSAMIFVIGMHVMQMETR
jgi:hypothetical protein